MAMKNFKLVRHSLLASMVLAQSIFSPQELSAQDQPVSKYVFTDLKEIPVLPVANQGRSGTCWAFSTGSFLESEILRLRGESIPLSKMYFVRSAYQMKAQNYIYRQGTSRFTEGGLAHDPIIGLTEFGLMPEANYTGLLGGAKFHDHGRMFTELEAAAKKFAVPANKLGAGWRQEIPAILDRHMGNIPGEFSYKGKTFTPASFLNYIRLVPGDYITITSFTHLPMYRAVELSIPANWANQRYYNLPLDEFMENVTGAINAGFSLVLDIDASEPTFSAELGVLPESEQDSKLILTEIRPEKKVSQEMRQAAFENFDTTDDHLVHITGMAKDQLGNLYFKCKNSWGRKAGRNGYLYLSIPYVRMKGISVLLHKDGLNPSTVRKLNV